MSNNNESFFDFDIDASSIAGDPVSKDGLYEVEVISSTTIEGRALFRVVVKGGSQEDQIGHTIDEGFNLPKSPDDTVLVFWSKFLVSLGLAKPGKKLRPSPSLIKGKRGYVKYALPAPGGKYDKKTWITAAQYAAQINAAAEAKAFTADFGTETSSTTPPASTEDSALAEFGV